MTRLTLHSAGHATTVQDGGRPGYLSKGLSRGGAVDLRALWAGAALLGQDTGRAVLEMAGAGAAVSVDADTRIALTGAEMSATLDGARLAWNASHLLPRGAMLRLGAARGGSYGYLHLGGGIDTPPVLGSRAAHLSAGIGAPLRDGDSLPLGADNGGDHGLTLDLPSPSDAPLRVAETAQTALFPEDLLGRFCATDFVKDARANRQGVRLAQDGAGFQLASQLSLPSEIVQPGDIQITGDGTAFVLLAECQATGGYPRIGRVIAPDLWRVAQAPAGAPLRFAFVDAKAAGAALRDWHDLLDGLPDRLRPLIRDPATMPDLLSYNLVGGVISAKNGDMP